MTPSEPSGFTSPSTVVISAPSACTASTVQDFTDLPFMSTVQAPQWDVSQPICAPLRFRFSRRKCTSSVRGSASPSTARPLIVMRICVLPIVSPSAHAALGAGDGPAQDHARDVALELDRAALVLDRVDGGERGGDRAVLAPGGEFLA